MDSKARPIKTITKYSTEITTFWHSKNW